MKLIGPCGASSSRAGRPRDGSGPPFAALLTGLPSHGVLPRLPVGRVTAAPAAVLVELDPVGRVPLRLVRLIDPPLALGAGERDCDSDSGGHFLVSTSR